MMGRCRVIGERRTVCKESCVKYWLFEEIGFSSIFFKRKFVATEMLLEKTYTNTEKIVFVNIVIVKDDAEFKVYSSSVN